MGHKDLFREPKNLKKWAIDLANACGGQRVDKSPLLTPLNVQKIKSLMDTFVEEHNQHTVEIMKQMEEE
tara:strand:+ start:392 stop:598 length:207 start_codon:yes stop_codon:yes gene_type:complete